MMSKIAILIVALTLDTSQDPSPRPQVPWKQAAAGYKFAFPRDHASHPDYKIEWWYYTGNVKAADGRRFGYQVTFFRVGIDHTPANPSRWAIRDLHMTHLAVSDASGQRYRYGEKLTRGGPGLAGAKTDQYYVWNDDWTAMLDQGDDPGGGRRERHLLQATSPQASINLTLGPGKPPVIHGRNGISQKGAQAGNASHYYSLTRMPTSGTIAVDGEQFTVTGESWMDHEFGTSFLEPEQRGWDWLSIQLSDGRELMLYQLRRADGSRDPRSSGSLGGADSSAISHSPASSSGLPAESERWRRRFCLRRCEKHVLRRMRWNQGRKGSPSRIINLRPSSVLTTPVSVALEMSADSATWRASMPSQIHTTQSTTKPVQVMS